MNISVGTENDISCPSTNHDIVTDSFYYFLRKAQTYVCRNNVKEILIFFLESSTIYGLFIEFHAYFEQIITTDTQFTPNIHTKQLFVWTVDILLLNSMNTELSVKNSMNELCMRIKHRF